jgi:predicted permease
MESFARAQRISPGFAPANLLTMKIALPTARYNTDTKKAKFFRELLPNVEGLSGVRNAAIALSIPTTIWTRTDITGVEGKPALDPNEPSSYAVLQSVTAGYFRTLTIALMRGRQFTERDNNPGAPPVVIVNDSLARRLWPGYPLNEEPIGRHIKEAYDKAIGWMEVVGIVADIHEGGLAYDASMPEFYMPYALHPPQRAYLVVRTLSDPLRLANAIRRRVLGIDSDQPVTDVRTMETVLDAPLGQRRLTTLLLGSFAAVAMLLALVGLYGVIAYSVEQRIQELGIRLALGAQQSDILRLVVGHGLRLAVIGVAVGICGATALTRILTSQLFHTRATDPTIFAGIAALFLIVALVACYLPARRAAKIDPMIALRVG